MAHNLFNRFTSDTGGKSNLENFAYLPTKIMDVVNGTPSLAQWNYRIVCNPLKDDLPLNRFRGVDDISTRMAYGLSWEDYINSNGARFQVCLDTLVPYYIHICKDPS